MTIDFKNAARRHNDSANMLYDKKIWGDADHLYGFAAECSLKEIMCLLGMMTKSGRPKSNKHLKHINELWNEYNSFVSGRNQLDYCIPSDNPFENWDASQRYMGSRCFDKSRVEPHKNSTFDLLKLLERINLNNGNSK